MKSDKDKLLRIMQYNFLADRLCTIKRYPHAKEFVRQFEWRGPMIMEEIKQADCDIVCVQELDRAADFYIEQFTNLGYNVLHESRPSILIKKEGLAIAYKRDKIELLKSESIDMSDLKNIYGNEFSKTNQARLCLFRHVLTGFVFVVANCHLYFDARVDFVRFA